MNKKNKKFLICCCMFLIMLIIVGTSYALWQTVLIQTDVDTITSGCLELSMDGKNEINIKKAYPFDEKSLRTYLLYDDLYHFTITNICTEVANASVNLETLNTGSKKLDDKYVNYVLYEDSLNLDEVEEYPYHFDNLEVQQLNNTKVIDNALNSYRLMTFDLLPNESREFNFALYLNPDTPAVTNVMGKTFTSKITVNVSQLSKSVLEHTIKYTPFVLHDDGFEELNSIDHNNYVNKIVFQNTMSPLEGDNVIDSWDSSLAQSKTIMNYVVVENGKKTLYVQSNDKIYLPVDSSYLFANGELEEIVGLEYVDTSRVVIMRSMFEGTSSLRNLDLSNFDTSQVIDMEHMFDGSGISKLDLSSFDTSKVLYMNDMFSSTYLLDSIDLSSFSIDSAVDLSYMFSGSNVAKLDLSSFVGKRLIDISNMFFGCSNLIDINLSNMNTSSVLYMNSLFEAASSLEIIDLHGFNTTNVKTMNNMFSDCGSLKSIDLSNFDTSNVIDMSRMFSECTSLTTLDLSSFNTRNVTTMEAMFFNDNGLLNLDISNFSTNKVENYNEMFSDCTVLQNISYGDKFIYRNMYIILMDSMFFNCPANTPPHSSWNDIEF